MRGFWRVSRPLYAATAASAQSAASSSSLALAGAVASRSSLGARRCIGFTATRWTPQTTGAAAASSETLATDAAAAAAAADMPVEDVDTPPVDLKDVGAETSKVLTIADVLTHRETEFSQQGSAATYFDEWESIPGTHTIQDAIDMMVEYKIGSLIVTEENAGIVGIVTERDVMKKTSPRALATDTERPVKEIMSAQIMCIPSTTTVLDALATMTRENTRHLAVINGEINAAVKKGSVPEEAMRCVLSIKDIVKAYADYESQKKAAAPTRSEPTAAAPIAATEAAAPAPVTPAAASPAPEGSADTTAAPPPPPATPVVTANTLLKKKHKKIKLILNTRVEDNISVAEAVEEMARHNFGAVLVVDQEQRVLGIFTERDYISKVLYPKEDPTRMRVTDVCTKKLACLQLDDSLEKCWTQAATMNFRHFPVLDATRKEKDLAGILSIKDIVREISKGHETPSGFRLMEFFKSKIAKDEPPAAAKPAETTDAKPEAKAAAVSDAPQKKAD